ncbi:hypothetical protein T09_9055 [Trichinella sp. T9]|nr:hypothetical protein T09_9055 [Trichinella sp. T9]
MLPTKRELGKRGGRAGSNRTDDTDAEMNLQFDTGVSSFNNDRGSNPVEARNEPARESGSLHSVKLTVFGVPLAKKNLHHTVHSPLPDERTLYLSIAGVQNPITVLTFGPPSRSRQASPNGYPKLAANKARLDRLLTELEELNIDAVDDNLLGGQLELTETLFRETDSLQADQGASPSRLWPKQENGPSRCDGCHSGNFRQTAAPARIGKLPELTLPLFDGEVLEFPTFWAQFEASVHVNTELDDATKFAYLLSNTTGRALEAIAGIPVTAANYPKAVGILQKRFGQPKIVARAHFLALWKAPECREMTRQGIQTLVDEITKQLRCLAAMGKDPHAG